METPLLDNSPLSIAVVGNMNNNGFSLLRYFSDLGAVARLYCFQSDQAGGLAHFTTEADTWSPELWRPQVEVLPFDNNIRSLYPFNPACGRIDGAVRAIAQNHSLVVGSGIAPALFAKAGCRLDAFFPYATGVELIGHLPFVSAMQASVLKRPFYRYAQQLQTRGILEARCCFNSEMSLSKQALDGIGRTFERLAIPMVYNRERAPAQSVPSELRQKAQSLRQHEFVVFCHSRHLWVQDPALSPEQFRSFTKHSDWLIRGFAELARSGADKAVLVLVEYGPDVEASKRLVHELGIEGQVIWLPKMKRREIMYLLEHVDVGVGEFHADPGIIWGGTGWEILASGKPLVQCFNFTREGYEAEFGHPPPPLLHADSPDSIAQQLRAMLTAPAERERIGATSRQWFNEHNGLGLARRWLGLIGVEVPA